MKELRGQEALRYAEEQGIFFLPDEDYMLRTEGALLGRRATLTDIDELFEERLGMDYDSTDLFPGEEGFNLLVERYGHEWIYVPLEGNYPEEEEQAVLEMFHGLLKEKEPSCGGDILDLATAYGPVLRETGFPRRSTTNLLFHAALRLVGKGRLEVIMDSGSLSGISTESYGNRRFFVPSEVKVSFSGLLCDGCQDRMGRSSLSLHRECSERLRSALGKATTDVKSHVNPI